MGRVRGEAVKLHRDIILYVAIDGQQGRVPVSRKSLTNLFNHGRTIRDISGVIEDRIAKQYHMSHAELSVQGDDFATGPHFESGKSKGKSPQMRNSHLGALVLAVGLLDAGNFLASSEGSGAVFLDDVPADDACQRGAGLLGAHGDFAEDFNAC